MGGRETTWRPRTRQRVVGGLVCAAWEIIACVLVVQAFTERGGQALALVAVVMAGGGAYGIRRFARSRITLNQDSDSLIIVNAIKTHTVPLAEISGIIAAPYGLQILRGGKPAITATAIAKSKWAVDRGHQLTRADDIASDILSARPRPFSDPVVPPEG